MTADEIKILSFDPSSMVTGYASMLSAGGCLDLVDCGLLKPKSAKAHHLERILDIGLEIDGLISEVQPHWIVIEMPSFHTSVQKRKGHGLAVYGTAAGAIWMRCISRIGKAHVVTTDEREWTKKVPKRRRQLMVANAFQGRYVMEKDPGGDAADGVGLGLWFHNERLPNSWE